MAFRRARWAERAVGLVVSLAALCILAVSHRSRYFMPGSPQAPSVAAPFPRTSEPPGRAAAADAQGVVLRAPLARDCRGAFVFPLSANVTMEVLDATYDTRPVAAAGFRALRPRVRAFRHVAVHVAVDEGLEPARAARGVGGGARAPLDAVSAVLHPADARVRVAVDHVLAVRCSRPIGRPSAWRVCIWSVSVALWAGAGAADSHAALSAALRALTASGAELRLTVPLRRTAGIFGFPLPAATVRPRIALSCIDGFEMHDDAAWLPRAHPGAAPCARSSDALLVLGSPVSGPKRNAAGAREAAHFAFRAMAGRVRFQTVAVALQPRLTPPAIAAACGASGACARRKHARLRRDMVRFRAVMDAELAALGLPRALRRRVLVSAYCRLGSAGPAGACARVRAYGQVGWGEAALAQLAFAHRWVGAMDLDEMLGNDPSEGPPFFRPQESAVRVLDEISAAAGGISSIKLKWFYANLNSAAEMPRLTRALNDSRKIGFSFFNRAGEEMRNRSFAPFLQENGKSFARCSVAVRTHVHNTIIGRNLSDVAHVHGDEELSQRHTSRIRVWHARLKQKFKGLHCVLSVKDTE